MLTFGYQSYSQITSCSFNLGNFPSRTFLGGEKWPGIDCLCMRDHSQKNLGICLHLEIVIFVSSKDVAICQLNYL